ncbi:dihydrofolate reductase [Thermoflavifilum thermophilum]|uniref:Dihydrofolate reductase n=1 Tax=Thermoflavifilum thermophilum TaxID=1393122 RepID=A0A1I7N175_9BACT|nr:dihydrofolate reductase [Thermoflavifilum thermophilum]SFV28388.1 dihydrofolate reductase [Thermoflavifilum thermophilum]
MNQDAAHLFPFRISAIVAATRGNVIGKDNVMPWHLPADLKYFKQTTWGKPLIMGRKTFESMGGKALPGRPHIVITRQMQWSAPDVEVVHNLSDAFRAAAKYQTSEVFVTGGADIFQQAWAYLQRIYLTRIHADIEGNRYFPHIDPHEWQLIREQYHEADEKNPYAMSFQVWERKR